MPGSNPTSPHEFMRRYPRTTAHIIAESLGYAIPTKAAIIGLHGMNNEPDYCEWLDACYQNDARRCLQDSIRNRHTHHGYMAEYKLAKKLVNQALETGDEPLFASWF